MDISVLILASSSYITYSYLIITNGNVQHTQKLVNLVGLILFTSHYVQISNNLALPSFHEYFLFLCNKYKCN